MYGVLRARCAQAPGHVADNREHAQREGKANLAFGYVCGVAMSATAVLEGAAVENMDVNGEIAEG